MGAKDLVDLRTLIEKQISTQYKQALDSITKKEILDQIEKLHKIELPKKLVDQEIHLMTQQLKKDEMDRHKAKNLKIAESRIKLGLILNEYGEKNNLKVSDEEVQGEVQKRIKGMPGQEKMVLDYYQKNPSAAQSLKGALYEEKILDLFKSKINLKNKNISTNEAEKIISDFNQLSKDLSAEKDHDNTTKAAKEKKVIKSTSNISKKIKKVSKK
jgi:trigger factor